VTTVGHAADGTMDTAGPAQGGFSLRRLLGGIADERRLAGFLEANRGGARYLVATTNAFSGAPLILETGEPVMAMGGFRGSDPALTPASLSDMIARRQVRYFLIGGGFGGFGGRPVLGDAVAGAARRWTTRPGRSHTAGLRGSGRRSGRCGRPPRETGRRAGATAGRARPGGRSPLHLYDCSGSGPAVAALAGHRSTDPQAIGVPGPRG